LVPKIHSLRNVISIIIFTGPQDRTNWGEEKTKHPKLISVVTDEMAA
jgi:hypothetical protein